MPYFAAVAHRGTNYFYGGLIDQTFPTEAAAQGAAERDVDERDEETLVAVFSAADRQAARIETIRRSLDWRWQPGGKTWVDGRVLRHHRWRRPSPTWNHDHCEFCFQRFMDSSDPTIDPALFVSGELASMGYGNVAYDNRRDDYYWICEFCFRDFDPFFHWEVIEEMNDPDDAQTRVP